ETGKSAEKALLPAADVLAQPAFSFAGSLTPEVTSMFSGEPGDVGPEEDLDVLSKRLRERLGDVPVPKKDKDFHPGILRMQARDLRGSNWDMPPIPLRWASVL
ncbi:MAG TPA: hypothetical protein VL147_05085, partial [Devosia sp.]|nr:hypothetical protein [Devosia sp.]